MTWAPGTSANQTTGGASVTTLTQAAGQAVAIGDAVCVGLTWGTLASVPATCVITDLNGLVTFTQSPTAADAAGQEINVVAAGIATGAGTPNIRVQWNPVPGTTAAQGGAAIVVDVFTGSDAASVIDGAGSGLVTTNAGAGTDNVNSGNWTTAVPGDLLYGCVTDTATGADSMTAGTGYFDGGVSGFVVVRTAWTTQAIASATTNIPFSTTAGPENFAVAGIAITPLASTPQISQLVQTPLKKRTWRPRPFGPGNVR